MEGGERQNAKPDAEVVNWQNQGAGREGERIPAVAGGAEAEWVSLLCRLLDKGARAETAVRKNRRGEVWGQKDRGLLQDEGAEYEQGKDKESWRKDLTRHEARRGAESNAKCWELENDSRYGRKLLPDSGAGLLHLRSKFGGWQSARNRTLREAKIKALN